MTGLQDDVTGHVITWTELSLSYMSPHPQTCLCMGGVFVGPAICYGPGAISMKEDWVQGAPLHLHTQLYTHFVPYTTTAGKDCPLQSSFRAVSRYPSPWYGVQNPQWGKGLTH